MRRSALQARELRAGFGAALECAWNLQRLNPEGIAEETKMSRLRTLCTLVLHITLLLAVAGLSGCDGSLN